MLVVTRVLAECVARFFNFSLQGWIFGYRGTRSRSKGSGIEICHHKGKWGGTPCKPHLEWTLLLLDSNNCKNQPRSGHPCSVHTKEFMKRYKESHHTLQIKWLQKKTFAFNTKKKIKIWLQIIKKLQRCKKFPSLNGSKLFTEKWILWQEVFCIEQSYDVKNGNV